MSAAELAVQADLSDGIKDPRLLQLYWYWRERKGIRRHPSRSDIDPLEFRYILGHVMMVDVLDSRRYLSRDQDSSSPARRFRGMRSASLPGSCRRAC